MQQRINELEQQLIEVKSTNHSGEYYRELFDNMLHEVHVWELVFDDNRVIKTWRLLDANKIALKSWNKKLINVIGRYADDIFKTDATQQFLPIIQKIFTEQQPHTWESYFDGTDQYLQMTTIPSGNIFISTGLDVTPMKKAEIALTETVLKLSEAIEAGNIGLWDWDILENKVTYSPEWKRQLGYLNHEITDDFEEWLNRIHPDDQEESLDSVNQRISNGNDDSHELVCRMRHKNGSYRWILAHSSILRDGSGNAIRMLGSHIDITERKKLEETILQQQKMQALGTLAGGIAHDFNNLLTPILGYSQLVKMSLPEDSKEVKYLTNLEESAIRAKELVQKILLISRKSVEKVETVNLNKMVNEVIDLLSLGKNNNISIHLNSDPTLPSIAADPSQIYQLILNLCTNATQAMPDGGDLFIGLSAETTSKFDSTKNESQNYACLTIKDTGYGMSKEIKERVFEPFFTTKSKSEDRGTGLGLSIVASVVKQHKGVIELHSEPGLGSEFKVYLPLVFKDSSNQEQVKDVVSSVANKTILFVDDEKSLCELGDSLLTHLGYQVLTFSECAFAIAHLTRHPDEIDLIITDYAMPDMNGPELVNELKQINMNIPIIMVTGFSQVVTEKNRVAWGCDAVMSKPYNVSELSMLISKLLDK